MEYKRTLDTIRDMIKNISGINVSDYGTSLCLYLPFSPARLCVRFQMSKFATFTIYTTMARETLEVPILNDANSIKFENSVYLIMRHILQLYNNHKQMCDLSAVFEHCKAIIAIGEL